MLEEEITRKQQVQQSSAADRPGKLQLPSAVQVCKSAKCILQITHSQPGAITLLTAGHGKLPSSGLLCRRDGSGTHLLGWGRPFECPAPLGAVNTAPACGAPAAAEPVAGTACPPAPCSQVEKERWWVMVMKVRHLLAPRSQVESKHWLVEVMKFWHACTMQPGREGVLLHEVRARHTWAGSQGHIERCCKVGGSPMQFIVSYMLACMLATLQPKTRLALVQQVKAWDNCAMQPGREEHLSRGWESKQACQEPRLCCHQLCHWRRDRLTATLPCATRSLASWARAAAKDPWAVRVCQMSSVVKGSLRVISSIFLTATLNWCIWGPRHRASTVCSCRSSPHLTNTWGALQQGHIQP